MEVKVYIVTFDNKDILQRCLKSISAQDLSEASFTIINNYVPEDQEVDLGEIPNGIKVINNATRPSFSTGHLSRNWNECLVNAIVDPLNPRCDIVILAQGDTVFKPSFVEKARELVKRYDYISFGMGDELQIVTPACVRKVGLFDERYCAINNQEGDYFKRCILFNSERTSINDFKHDRVHNALGATNDVIEIVPSGGQRQDKHHIASGQHGRVGMNFCIQKWGHLDMRIDGGDVQRSKQYMMYPYFESKLPDLHVKYFVY